MYCSSILSIIGTAPLGRGTRNSCFALRTILNRCIEEGIESIRYSESTRNFLESMFYLAITPGFDARLSVGWLLRSCSPSLPPEIIGCFSGKYIRLSNAPGLKNDRATHLRVGKSMTRRCHHHSQSHFAGDFTPDG